jgi:hypothetical protein
LFVRVRALFVRCSYAVRTLFASLFVRCSYERTRARTHPRELRDAPLWGAENKRQKNPQPQIPQNELYVSSVPLTTFPVFYPYATPEACSAVRHATRSAAHQQVPPGRCKHTAHPTSWYPSGRKSPSPLLLAWSLSWLFVFVLVPKYYN